jgi:hypothetical protein
MFEDIKPVPGFKERWKQIPLRDRIIVIISSPLMIVSIPGLLLGMKIEKRFATWGKWKRRLVGYGSAIPLAWVAAVLSNSLPPDGQGFWDMWPLLVILFMWMPVILPLLAGPIQYKEIDARSDNE